VRENCKTRASLAKTARMRAAFTSWLKPRPAEILQFSNGLCRGGAAVEISEQFDGERRSASDAA